MGKKKKVEEPVKIDLAAWRKGREPGWTRDIGYRLQDELQRHSYRYDRPKPDDPGWNYCTCGWEGYWCEFNPHVADHLREVVIKGL